MTLTNDNNVTFQHISQREGLQSDFNNPSSFYYNPVHPFVSEVVISSFDGGPMNIIQHPPTRDNFFADILQDNVNYTLVPNCSLAPNISLCLELKHAPSFDNKALVKGLVLCIIAVLSFIGNMITITSIVRNRRQSVSTVYMLLMQLAIADLLVTLFPLFAEGLWTFSVAWYGGTVLCKTIKFMQMFSLYLSTYVLVLIGFDRLCAVRFPMKRSRAKNHVRKGIVCIWVLSAVFSIPQAVIFRVMRGPFVEEFHQCVTYGFYLAEWQEQLYTSITLILMFLLPLLTLVSTYVATFLTISDSGRSNMFSDRLSRTPFDDARNKILHKAKIKSLMITVVIVLTFVVCWTPYYVVMVICMFLNPDEGLVENLQTGVFCFGSSTALFNPLIYGAFHLRPRKKPRSKSTSFVNSSSSRVENSFITTLRRSHGKSPEERRRTIGDGRSWARAHFKVRQGILTNVTQTTEL